MDSVVVRSGPLTCPPRIEHRGSAIRRSARPSCVSSGVFQTEHVLVRFGPLLLQRVRYRRCTVALWLDTRRFHVCGWGCRKPSTPFLLSIVVVVVAFLVGGSLVWLVVSAMSSLLLFLPLGHLLDTTCRPLGFLIHGPNLGVATVQSEGRERKGSDCSLTYNL